MKKINYKRNKIIIGELTEIDNKLYLVSAKKKYLVTGQREELPHHIALKTILKAVMRTKGKFDEPAVFLLKILQKPLFLSDQVIDLIEQSKVREIFSDECDQEAQKFGNKVLAKDTKGRLDLTNLALCTIDGKTAKDFDDAVFAQKNKDGYHVFVAIADVSHYVKQNSVLDLEAFNRGTSIYYPGHCIPMLPESLSNGLCSLKPKVLRLVLVASFQLSFKGAIGKISIDRGVIKSQARLTYEEVQNFYDGKEPKKLSPEIKDSLTYLREAALILRSERHKRGAIDFDLSESLVALDKKGEPISINPSSRLDSHKIIEDLMVAANEIVAEFFIKHKIPSIYRVHEEPNEEKLQQFFETATALSAIKTVDHSARLSDVIKQYENSRYKDILNSLMLRAMMQARYSEQNLKHFGLASQAYTHFTSPIRRYADLIVHRQLSSFCFEKSENSLNIENLAHIAQSISEKEGKAVDLERKIHKIFAAFFMLDKVGENFLARVISCTEFGFFVRLKKHHVEGLVHISSIAKQRVIFMPTKLCLVISGSNKKITVGDEVKVTLINVNADRGFIDFELSKKL